MLFGSQPFIADMTELAVSEPSPVAAGMADRFSRRADHHREASWPASNGLYGSTAPRRACFALVDVRATGLSGEDLRAGTLLDQPEGRGDARRKLRRGPVAAGCGCRLTQPDDRITEATKRIAAHAAAMSGERSMTTVGIRLVEGLVARGVDTVFGIPGVHTIELYRGLSAAGDKIRHVTPRHEQGAGFMADGYARVSAANPAWPS
jgi:hypothetical protein